MNISGISFPSLSLLIACSVLFSSVGIAADTAAPSTASPPKTSPSTDTAVKPTQELGSVLPGVTNQKKHVGPEYLQMTYPNLYRLAWAMNVYKSDDNDALDNFLKISECKLYQGFYNNEFEWDKIRKATRAYFEKYDGKISMYYEYVQPLLLGRYDASLQGFPLYNADKYVSLRMLQMASFRIGDTPCGSISMDPYVYPPSALLNIISPLSLTFIRVPKELAEEYLNWRIKQVWKNTSIRQAYIRFRVRVDGYVGIERQSGASEFIFNGRLMQVDVFADKDLLMPLYNQIF